MKRTWPLGLAVIVASLFLLGGPAYASCAAPPPLDEIYAGADIVFRGTVTATAEGNDRIATVRVEEVWKGPPLPGTVVVRGGPQDTNVATSVDRSFDVGNQYLFFPVNRRSPFKDNICTATRRYRAALERLRDPATAGPGGAPAPLPFTGSEALPAWLLLASGAIGGGIALLPPMPRRRG